MGPKNPQNEETTAADFMKFTTRSLSKIVLRIFSHEMNPSSSNPCPQWPHSFHPVLPGPLWAFHLQLRWGKGSGKILWTGAPVWSWATHWSHGPHELRKNLQHSHLKGVILSHIPYWSNLILDGKLQTRRIVLKEHGDISFCFCTCWSSDCTIVMLWTWVQ